MDDADVRVVDALRMIRDADGAVYSQDLYEHFEIDPELSAHVKDTMVLEFLNDWVTPAIVEWDSTGSIDLSGAIELVSVHRFRTFLDLLTGMKSGVVPRLHPVAVERDADGQPFFRYETDLEIPTITHANRTHWTESVERRYASITNQPFINLPTVTRDNLKNSITWDSVTHRAVIDLSGKYVWDFSIDDAKTLIGGFSDDFRIRIHAMGAVFDGTKTDFSDTVYDEIDLRWAVFNTAKVSFDRAAFSSEADTEEGDTSRIVNLRDTTFCSAVSHVDFDRIRCTHETLKFSLEDAVVRGARLSFEKSEFGTTFFDFYQARFLNGASVQFLETSMGESRIDFADSNFQRSAESHHAAGDVVFYRVEPLPVADLAFGKVGDLRIWNSTIENSIKFAGIDHVSLWRTSVTGGLVKVDLDTTGSKLWFLDAVHSPQRSSTMRPEVANEFAVLKEVFHGQGEYDLEDEAFVRHMRFKPTTLGGRFSYWLLDIVGLFGTSPARIATSFLLAWLVWFSINLALLANFSDQYVNGSGNVVADAVINTIAGLLQANAVVPPDSLLTHSLWLLQSFFGWFFLGYFFSALIRKTLR